MEMLKHCFNPKVIIGLVAIAAGVAIFAPQAFVAALPLLFLAACPLSMVAMMRMSQRSSPQREGQNEASKKESL